MVVYCADVKLIQKLNRRLGGSPAKYYDMTRKGHFLGASWYVPRSKATAVRKQLGKLKNRVEILP